jgi:exosortase A-associated hydrolase 2
MKTKLEAHFRPDGRGGFRLYLRHAPAQGPIRGTLLLVHAWAEEMNKCRHVMADIGRTLAAEGWATLLVDLLGCGDSSGDFGDAAWSDWIDDAQEGAVWLRQQHPSVPLWLGGLRAGALLAAQAASRIDAVSGLLFVQPVHQGRQQLQQFLRLAEAARWAGGSAAPSSSELRAHLASGRAVDIAGYRLGPGLADGLASATLAPPADLPPSRLCWIDVSARELAQASPASSALADDWRKAGWSVAHDVVPGPSFWQTSEIEDAPAVAQTVLRKLADTLEVT